MTAMGASGGPLNLGGMFQQLGQAMVQRMTHASPLPSGVPPTPSGAMMQGAGAVDVNALLLQLQSLQSRLAPHEQAQLLRGLLGLPQDVRAGLAMLGELSTPAQTTVGATLAELLAQSPDAMIRASSVCDFLGRQASDGLNHLLKLMQSSPAATLGADNGTFSELIGLLSTIGSRAQTSGAMSFTLLNQLYLPFCPLTVTQPFDPPGGDASNDAEGETTSGSPVTLYLDTERLGKFKISVSSSRQMQIVAMVEHDAIATPHLPALARAWQEDLMKDGMPEPQWTALERPASSGGPQSPGRVASMVAGGSQGVSLTAFLAACLLSRHILEADERLSVLRQRQTRGG